MAYIPSECSLEEYEKVIYSGDAKNRLYVKHGNTIIGTNGDNNASPFASKLTIKRRILKNGSKTINLNNLISQEIDLVLHDYKIEDLSEEIEIKIGTFIDSVNDYVYVPIGKFLIQDNPTTDKNKTTYKLRDFSVKFDFYYNGKPLMDANGGKATKLQILQDICKEAGVVCNIKSFVGYNEEVGIYDNSVTARTYITYLAEQAGKMASINRYGELIFVDITSDESSIIGTNEITLENAVEKRIDSFLVEGNSKQQTSSGKNLYNVNDLTWASSNAVVDKDGWITITYDNTNGTDIAYRNHWTKNLNIETSKNYNLIFEIKEVSGEGYFYGTSLGANQLGQFTNTTFNLADLQNNSIVNVVKISNASWNDTVGLRTFLMISAGKSASITFRISVLEDTTITPENFKYEPYGISPSPDYPSEIETVKGIENYLNVPSSYVLTGNQQIDFDTPLPAGTYTIGFTSKTTDGANNCRFILSSSTSTVQDLYFYGDFSKTFTTTEECSYITIYSQDTWANSQGKTTTFNELRLNKSNTLQSYTPYGNYLIVENKTANIFIPSEMSYWSNLAPSWERYGNGIKINTSSTDAGSGVYSSFGQMSNKVDGKTITFSFSIKSSVDTKLLIGAEYLGKIVDVTTEYKRFSQTLNDFWNYDWYPFVFYNQYANGAEIYIQDMQLEIDDKESPYNECETKTITYNLQGNELVAIGDVKDELDIVTGTLTKRIGKVVLNGSEDWGLFNGTTDRRFDITVSKLNIPIPRGDDLHNKICISNYLRYMVTNENPHGYFYLSNEWLVINDNDNYWSDLNTFKTWLSNNPVTLYYELAQPETIQPDATEIKTFEGTNHITLESGLETYVSLEYASAKHTHDISPDIVEKFTAGDIYKLSKVLFEAGVNKFEDGTDDNDTLYLNSDNPYIIEQNQVSNIFPNVKGFEINSFKTGKILGNPTVDPSDLIKVEYDGIIYKTLAQYTLNFGGTMTSTYETIVEHEAKQSNVSNSGTASMKKYVKAQLDNIDAKFSLEVGEVNSSIDDVKDMANNNSDRISEADSKINDTNTNLEEVIGRTTKLEQDSKGWTFEFTAIKNSVTDLDDKVNENDAVTKEIKNYIKFTENGDIVLKGTDSECSLVISKDRISFKTGDNESAYITNNELYITDNTVLNKQTVGNPDVGRWETKPDSLGNLNTRWIG